LSFQKLFQAQVDFLKEGKPLAAFDAFYADGVTMFDNDVVFASDKKEGRSKQLPFFQSAKSIEGCIEDVAMRADPSDDSSGMGVFRNRSRFETKDGKRVQIDGVVWQKWQNGAIVEERYYRDKLMADKIKQGILKP
jgi:hypothetical protein